MRQLSAILFADIMGYTAMMQENEEHAVRAREKFRQTLDREIADYRGEIIQYSGDGALCTFNSAIDAVRSAIAIQKEMREDPQVPLRIGIHSGDVMVDEKNIYGDGVNIAARIESFAVAGGIFISAKVYDEIKNQSDIEAISVGLFELKNVRQPMEIYAVSNAGLTVPSKEMLEGKGRRISDQGTIPAKISRRTVILSSIAALVILMGSYFLYQNFSRYKNNVTDKSIAVLPFENLSNNAEDEYFTEGMTDEILTELAQISGLRVLSRTSTTQYKDTKKTMKEIGAELGVANLVEGSVRKVGDRLRVIVQLINAKTDDHLWAETYNREVKDVFAIQSEIALQIATELDNKLTAEEKKRLEEKPTENLEAYDYFMRGKSYANGFWTKGEVQNVPLADRMFRASFKLDPNFVDPYAYLIAMYLDVYYYHMGPGVDSYRQKAKGLLDTLLALNIDKAAVHIALGSYKYKVDRDYKAAIAEFSKAIEEDPSRVESPLLRSEVYRAQGKMKEALADLKKVLDRSPNEEWYLYAMFEDYLAMRNADEALKYIDKLIALVPDNVNNYRAKASCLVALRGDLEGARRVLITQPIPRQNFDDDYKFIDMLEGNYAPILSDRLQHSDSMEENEFVLHPYSIDIAIIYQAQGKTAEAKKYFAKARDVLEARKGNSEDARVLTALGVAYAGLGDSKKALEYGNRARELMPLSKDIFMGLPPLGNMALIHSFLGDEDEAVEILNQLMQLPFSWNTFNTIPFLKMLPQWNSLHSNPGFKKLVGEN